MTYDEDIYKGEYRGNDPIIQLIAAQVNRIMEAGSRKDIDNYIESIDRLIDILPPDLEETILEYIKKNEIAYDTSNNGKQTYIDLMRFIKYLMSKENIIWKRSRFEIGKE